jgi:hypothetical protein
LDFFEMGMLIVCVCVRGYVDRMVGGGVVLVEVLEWRAVKFLGAVIYSFDRLLSERDT